MSEMLYNADYYKDGCGMNYSQEEYWMQFFGVIAEKIIQDFHPKTVLDAGCAWGYLVAALRDRGVEAYGVDISEYAISQVREDIQDYCRVVNLRDGILPKEFPAKFDFVTNVEILEHLKEPDSLEALKNLCSYSDRILFSSSPDDITENTHYNVQQVEYWCRHFAHEGFFRVLEYSAEYLSPQAILLEKKEQPCFSDIVDNYERQLRISNTALKKEKTFRKHEMSYPSTIYQSNGQGFTQEKSETYYYNFPFDNNFFSREFTIDADTIAIRFDPIENVPCVIRHMEVFSNTGKLSFKPTNGIVIEEYYIFTNTDPQFLIETNGNEISQIKITAEIYPVEQNGMVGLLSVCVDLFNEMSRMVGKCDLLGKKYDNHIAEFQKEQEIEKEKWQAELDEILAEQEEKQKRFLAQTEDIKKQLDFYSLHYPAAIDDRTRITNQYNAIAGSKSWKLTKPLRVIFDGIKKMMSPVKKNDKITQIEDIKYVVEEFEHSGDIINSSGWLFLPGDKIKSAYLKIKSNREYSFPIAYGMQRDDVALAFDSVDAAYCGFYFKIGIKNISNYRIFICYQTVSGMTGEISLDRIKGQFRARMAYYKGKFTKENIRKAFLYLKKGKANAVFNALKNPVIHIVEDKGLSATNFFDWTKENYVESPTMLEKEYQGTIDIVLPIYNGYQYFNVLFSSIQQTEMMYRLIIINDCSPDLRVKPYLEKLAASDNRIILLETEKNLGFIGTVNKGLSLAENHVAIVNSDVELPKNWLERLMNPILQNDKVASSTPFTNSGTLCSFPNFGSDNALFLGMTVNEIDSAFQKIKPTYTEMPTGVGFCMGMSIKAIKDIGILDSAFGRGYGEENDWCQRAILSGYTNIMVENLFVFHNHGGSFKSEERNRLIENNGKILSAKYPRYLADIAAFFSMDPLADYRRFALMILCEKAKTGKTILVFDHNIGGGASSYLTQWRQSAAQKSNAFAIIRYDVELQSYLLFYHYGEYTVSYLINNFSDIHKLTAFIDVGEIYINNLVTYPDLYNVLAEISKLKNHCNVPMTFLLHDYFAVCPTINLLNDQNCYCDLPDENYCNKCLTQNEFCAYASYKNIGEWRKNWKGLLSECTRIVAFSQSSKDILQKSYADTLLIDVVPHKVEYLFPTVNNYKLTDTLNIGLLGYLNNHKGIEIIESMLKIIETQKSNIKIVLFGESIREIKSDSFISTGRYSPEALPKLAAKYDVDIFFVSSICPETFSYTTEEAMKMGYPVATFNLGAPAERVAKYSRGLIINQIDAQYALDKIMDFGKEIISQKKPSQKERYLFVTDYISFSSRYRVEHFMEQLLFCGIESDFNTAQDIHTINPQKYTSVVIYRSEYTKALAKFVGLCHDSGIKVFYDIDDYIFNYDCIKDLSFLSDAEYKDFEAHSKKIFNCMQLCDGFFTSTNAMKRMLQEEFPQKEVTVNRNVASLEMATLSLKAITSSSKNSSRVILGYFSGSKTHNEDFEIVQPAITAMMEKYSNVYLHVVGQIDIGDEFKKFHDRVINTSFVDWRDLPALIASVDINLLPVQDTVFHECKSENKWMEAAWVKVPTVASYNKELAGAIQNGEDGYLCKSADQLKETLESLILDSELREKIGNAAHARMRNEYITISSGQEAGAVLYKNSDICKI